MNDAVDLILCEGYISLGEDSQYLMAALDREFFDKINSI